MNRLLVTLLSLLTFMSMEASTMIADWRNYGGVQHTYTETKSFTAKQGDILQCQCSGSLRSGAYLKLYLTVNGVKKALVSYDYNSNLSDRSFKILNFQLTEDNNYTLTYEYRHAGGGTAYGAHARAYLISVAESDYNTPLSDGDEFHLDGFHYKYNNNVLSVCQCSYYQYDGDIVIPTTITYRGGSYVVKGIENEAFYKCTGISTVYLNDSISTMGSSVFEGCTSLNEVHLPTNLTSIGDRLFFHCSNLTSVVIPSNVTTIGSQVFYECKKLASVTIPDKATVIGTQAFYGCNSLNSVVIPDNVTKVGASAFLGCSGLKTVSIGRNITEIGGSTFLGCSSLSSIVIPSNVISIGNNAFCSCSGLTTITIPDKVTSIGEKAFSDCSGLESVIIGGGTVTIGGFLFSGCMNLKDITWNIKECSSFPTNSISPLYDIRDQIISFRIGDNVDKIPSQLCCGMSNLQSINIPDNVTTIGEEAFSSCRNIESANIGNGVTDLGAYSFHNCNNLSSLKIGKGISRIRNYTFRNCNLLDTLIIPNNVEYIEESAFHDCSNLVYANIGSGVKSIGRYAFAGCSSLSNVISNALTPPTVGSDAFSVYGNLYVPKGTKGLYASADVWKNFNIIEMIDAEAISINQKSSYINVGETQQLDVTIMPDGANENVSWSSDNSNCVEIDQDGMITGKKIGEATITAKTTDGTDLTSTCKVYVRIPLSKVLLDKHSVTIYTGGDISLIASVSPESATYKTINWTSSKPSVATVDENGKVTAVSNGTAKIYARSTDGTNLCDSCTVTVKTLAKSIQMSKSSLDMIVGEQMSLSTTVLPATTSDKRCTWTSSNPNVATVSSSGNVTAVSTGVTTITATTTDGSNLTAKSSVTVTNPVISVSLNKQVTSLYVGQTTTLIPYCVPENADNTNITWASSNETTAVVQNGVVTAKALGTAVISATSVTGKTAKCTVNVVPTPAAGIILNAMTLAMTVDEQFNLTATVKPDDTTNKTVKWTSNNVNVVAVSSDGKVTAKKSGTAIITVRTTDGSSLSATCTIVVTSPVRAISMNKQEAGMFVGESVQITASCSPLDADNTTVSWTSSNNNIATVSKDGKIKAVGAGVATITATTTDGTNLSASCRVTVSKNNQTITWNQTFTDIAYGGEMTPLDATATSGMKIRYKLNDESVAVIFDLGDVVYLNPANCGKTTITAWQEGNYAYEKTKMTKEVTVTDKVCNQMSTLVAYYSNSSAVSSIVVELANQLAHTSTSVTTKDIKSVNGEMNLADYGAVVMVYPLCDGHMAEPMLNFLNVNSKSMTGKAVSYVEYGEKNVTSANAKALHITVDDLERKEDLISEWIYRQQPTSIQSISSGKATANNMHDLQGRKLTKAPRRGIYIENGIKKIR